MSIRSPVPPAGANHTQWHEARDTEVKATERERVLREFEAEALWHEDSAEVDDAGPSIASERGAVACRVGALLHREATADLREIIARVRG